MSLATGGGSGARIGPNAITRLTEALEGVEGKGTAAKALNRAGLAAYVAAPPECMVDEAEVIALHAAVRAAYGNERAQTLAWIAGRKTGDYLLAHRVPKPMQRVLKLLPAPIAARVLLKAIARHAWTFAGSGRFSVKSHAPLTVEIAGCPLCRGLTANEPSCAYFAATLERLFSALVHPDATVRETACAATGAPACLFVIDWRRPRR
jgi:divinyl protochlorophyllide a 8-vinyl-reductase